MCVCLKEDTTDTCTTCFVSTQTQHQKPHYNNERSHKLVKETWMVCWHFKHYSYARQCVVCIHSVSTQTKWSQVCVNECDAELNWERLGQASTSRGVTQEVHKHTHIPTYTYKHTWIRVRTLIDRHGPTNRQTEVILYIYHSSGRPRIFRFLASVGNASSWSSSPERCTEHRERWIQRKKKWLVK